MKGHVQYSSIGNLETLLRYFLIVVFFIVISITSNSFATVGEQLIIIGDIVNVRAAPSTNSDTLIKLLKDREVTEIQRQQQWIEIETHRKDIKTGWVHQSLLAKREKKETKKSSRNTSSPSRFDKFMERFNEHNEVVKKQNGIIYFSEVKNKGQGQIEIIATDAWVNAEREERGIIVKTVFKLWSNVVPVGSSMSIRIFDAQGEQHMLIVR
ncbi:MAG TPA: SH3 domain-containing protein [Thiotrichaceae bacterium]|jgi:uncharacterized protein YgiM (DUF1202 family)|nr:SH3 domain-containing protein [Thiotrichaceae bacterium]HIM08658.1 SH3 domain-containing protein [Gammaproteobacteria bacterium]